MLTTLSLLFLGLLSTWAASCPSDYTMTDTDSASTLAAANLVPLEEFLKVNPSIVDPDELQTGLVVSIPCGSLPNDTPAKPEGPDQDGCVGKMVTAKFGGLEVNTIKVFNPAGTFLMKSAMDNSNPLELNVYVTWNSGTWHSWMETPWRLSAQTLTINTTGTYTTDATVPVSAAFRVGVFGFKGLALLLGCLAFGGARSPRLLFCVATLLLCIVGVLGVCTLHADIVVEAGTGLCFTVSPAGDEVSFVKCATDGGTDGGTPSTAAAVRNTCEVNGAKGSCIPVAECTAPKTSLPSFCPRDPVGVNCCFTPLTPPTPAPNRCTANGLAGSCLLRSACVAPRVSVANACPKDPVDVLCCIASSGVDPTNGGGTSPPWTPYGPACTTVYGKHRGNCMSVNDCTGGTVNGLCPGSSKCCIRESNPVKTPATTLLTMAYFTALFENVAGARAKALHPYFLEAATSGGINTCKRLAAFCAQLAHESLGLLYMEEIASGAAYEGRQDLGNTQAGDGRRYKGRGAIQITGRANYRAYGQARGVNAEGDPEILVLPKHSFGAAVWFWNTRGLSALADVGTASSFLSITKKINGGTNGLDDRQRRWARAKSFLGC